MQKSLLNVYLERMSRGDVSCADKLCNRLAERLVHIPVTQEEKHGQGTTVSVVRFKDGDKSVVPMFTSEKNFEKWCADHSHNGESISLLGADFCRALDPQIWLLVDPDSEAPVEFPPLLVTKIWEQAYAGEEIAKTTIELEAPISVEEETEILIDHAEEKVQEAAAAVAAPAVESEPVQEPEIAAPTRTGKLITFAAAAETQEVPAAPAPVESPQTEPILLTEIESAAIETEPVVVEPVQPAPMQAEMPERFDLSQAQTQSSPIQRHRRGTYRSLQEVVHVEQLRKEIKQNPDQIAPRVPSAAVIGPERARQTTETKLRAWDEAKAAADGAKSAEEAWEQSRKKNPEMGSRLDLTKIRRNTEEIIEEDEDSSLGAFGANRGAEEPEKRKSIFSFLTKEKK